MSTAESAVLAGAKAMSPYEVSGYTYGMHSSRRTQECAACDTRWVAADDSPCFFCAAPGAPVLPLAAK